MIESTYLQTTRTAYDAVAVQYAELFRTALDSRPLDRALLTAFAELVRAAGAGPVADLGCGPGQVAAHLHSLGTNVFGVDLSPTMVALARGEHPGLRFDEGSMTALDLADGTLGGIVAWYSIIHTPPEQLPEVFAEFHRVLAPGGHLLIGFLGGDERPARAFDHKVAIAYRWSPGHLAELLRRAGFTEIARLLREPGESERFQQAFLLVGKPGEP